MGYSVNLNVFQGPFELLFHLIEKREIDIYDIPISEITEQYLNYLETMKHYNMNITSEFILMAATLLEIKSQMLIPNKEKEEDPRLDLVNKLLEYKSFKDVTTKFKEFENESSFYFSKPKEEMALTSDANNEQVQLNEINIFELYTIFVSLMNNHNVKREHKDNYKIYRENYSVKQCLDSLIKRLKKDGKISLFNTIKEVEFINKEFIITTFLAILEISNMKGYIVCQDSTFSDIIVKYSKEGEQIA